MLDQFIDRNDKGCQFDSKTKCTYRKLSLNMGNTICQRFENKKN